MKILYPISIFLMLSSVRPVFAQHAKELPPGFYVVVASFSPTHEDYALRKTNVLKKQGFSPGYGFNSKRNFYYVYLSKFSDRDPSIREMLKTRENKDFYDAWVRIVTDQLEMEEVTREDVQKVRADNATSTAGATSFSSPAQPDTKTQTTENAKINGEETTQTKIADQATTPPPSYDDVTDNPDIVQYKKMNLGNTEVFLSLYNAQNDKVIDGMVKVIDTDRAKSIKEVKGNDYLILPNPNNKTRQLTLLAEVFGYRKVQVELNYENPLADTVKTNVELVGTTLVINFDMVRYKTGDFGTLYNVYFYNDAAVMLPESKYELTSLVNLMNENKNYRVLLHGHTNGNYHGKIINVGPARDFFSLDNATNSVGSAKDLSRQRAETIKEYLIANGIDGSRVEVKAWGGKKPIYDKHSANAKRNVRVEVEILSD